MENHTSKIKFQVSLNMANKDMAVKNMDDELKIFKRHTFGLPEGGLLYPTLAILLWEIGY